jgi:GT2 family glycosyltransferase
MRTPELTVAIVLFNSAARFPQCLDSIRDEVITGWAELIAVDNASPDRSVEILNRELPEARLVTLDENRGFAVGANAALTSARGRYWLLLNPDVTVPPGGLQMLVSWMDAHSRIAIASPELYDEGGNWEAPGRAFPSIFRLLLELSRLHRLLPARLRGRLLRGSYWTGADQLDAGWVPATAAIIRPDAVREVGRLRDDLFMYGEDLEWCWRLRGAGWKAGVCSSVTFTHATSSSVLVSWGAAEKERRIAAGIDAACRAMYGMRHARALAAVTACAFMLEAAGPGRVEAHRERMRRAAGLWWRLATKR